ncbi:hypothetical protein [Halobacillus campisalis]|uniref:Permuted papain-like amidase enzyme, YaeF/YiiX, C92 family n=1 Tax=Halobacillus campisalis TaxID=435909 RepID=A0ABW2K1H8_9BACI|nr:hypothetical protein [Halobacillus campisalis]
MGKNKSIIIGLLTGLCVFFVRPKKVIAPVIQSDKECYPDTSIKIQPGDLLFSPIGKSESKYVGHVGMINNNLQVVHSVPAGLVKDPVVEYYSKFRGIRVYGPNNPSLGVKAAHHLELLFTKYPEAYYRVLTPLNDIDEEQYCTKMVWQAYYHGAGVNLSNLKGQAKAIHPALLKDKRIMHEKGSTL